MSHVLLSLASPPRITHLARSGLPAGHTYRYRLSDRWAIHLYQHPCRITIGESVKSCLPGTLSITPPGITSVYEVTGHFSYYCLHMECDEHLGKIRLPLFLETQTPLYASGETWYSHLSRRFEDAISLRATDPGYAQAVVWEMLHSLAAHFGSPAAHPCVRHPILAHALAVVESDPAHAPKVAALARHVGTSSVHLTRLFQEGIGESPAAHVRRLRMEFVRDQLVHTTKPVKLVAWEAGYNDLQAFNKLCKRHLGKAPRQLRSKD